MGAVELIALLSSVKGLSREALGVITKKNITGLCVEVGDFKLHQVHLSNPGAYPPSSKCVGFVNFL